MAERYYLIKIVITSSGTEDRNFTAYDDKDVALRKFHEAFNVIGGGPQSIKVLLLNSNLFIVKQENWLKPEEPESETIEE